MIVETTYLCRTDDAPDFHDDPEFERLTGAAYEIWRPCRIDIMDVSGIYDIGIGDRCEIRYSSGDIEVIGLPYEAMCEIHHEFFLTVDEVQEATRNNPPFPAHGRA